MTGKRCHCRWNQTVSHFYNNCFLTGWHSGAAGISCHLIGSLVRMGFLRVPLFSPKNMAVDWSYSKWTSVLMPVHRLLHVISWRRQWSWHFLAPDLPDPSWSSTSGWERSSNGGYIRSLRRISNILLKLHYRTGDKTRPDFTYDINYFT